MPEDDPSVPAGLTRILADCFVLRTCVQMAVWDLQPGGSDDMERRFQRLIAFLDETAQATAVRIQVLGGAPTGDFDTLIQLASCRPSVQAAPTQAAEDLALATMAVVRDFHTMAQLSRASGDETTAHFLFSRVGYLEEAIWRCSALVASAATLARDGAGHD